MKKVLINMIFILISLSTGLSFAAKTTTKSIKINQYFAATCDDYMGTWEGFASDPADLFQNGGPWPILVHLFHKDEKMIGRSTAIKNVVPEKEIWADCKEGVLKNIFWGAKGDCGAYSQQGLLVSKNVLILNLHYENAMIGTDMLLLLRRKNNSYPYSAPKNPEDYTLGKIESCH